MRSINILRLQSLNRNLSPSSAQNRSYCQGKASDKNLGLGVDAKKGEDFASWYTQTVTRAELIDYHDVAGCYILRPWSYSLWEHIQSFFDAEIKCTGVQNAYFPLFVTEKALNREKEHVEGFAAEVAWVTRAGNKNLAEAIALRPTSETIMYPAYAKWIQSWRDLPLQLNQWTNVVRWEFDRPTPFIRSREFLWQEGHTAWETKEEAEKEVYLRLEQYRMVYEDLLAVPVIKGRKTINEKFAGADFTTTIEAYVQEAGKAVQAATSHHLGQNFAKMFDIKFKSRSGEGTEYAWQNSWGLTTRSESSQLGVMTMVHGDDSGLVLPPRVAPIQVVLIPIYKKDADNKALEASVREIESRLLKQGLRVHVDDREHVRPGFKYSHWEMKGVPLRIELGVNDLAKRQVTAARRDSPNSPKLSFPIESLHQAIPDLLNDIHSSLFNKAKAKRESNLVKVSTLKEFIEIVKVGKLALAPFCDTAECETNIKSMGGEGTVIGGKLKSLCTPLEQTAVPHGAKCFNCEHSAKNWTLFGKSY